MLPELHIRSSEMLEFVSSYGGTNFLKHFNFQMVHLTIFNSKKLY